MNAHERVLGSMHDLAAVTIEMSTNFLRPFTEKEEFIIVRAEVGAQSRTLLVLKAEAGNKKGELIATSTSHSLIATDQVLKTKRKESNKSK
jgi:acyl-coenzyme A thioesterase PaaI-like protein